MPRPRHPRGGRGMAAKNRLRGGDATV